MKIAVMGAGGVGGYFGGLLAKAGQDVTFIARGPHLSAIVSDGLAVTSDLSGDFTVKANATDDTAAVGPVDLVLYTVKMYHNAEAIPAVRPMIGPDTVVLTLQNGVDNGHLLAADLGAQHVMVGTAVVLAGIEKPGLVAQRGQVGSITFGEISGGITDRGQTLLDVFQAASWNVELSADAMRALWRKFVYLTGSATVNAATQITYAEMRAVPETRELIKAAWREIVAVAHASGADPGDDVLDWCESSLDAFPAQGRTSLANDFQAGRPVEIEGLTGAVVRLGREHDVPTPVHTTVYALLKPAALKIAGEPLD
ncbi:MAG: 2-dehydropantoate 2-reductase [SAR202 cluster bacterium]|jgi:2-dehydropantoate 2-reductase|nr:2-dehydropantoate 2-reductase [Chloroflexota bacterium]MDP6421627.1 2-dehydropantoate 2-reductase [SAR202 cluster bacterium]HAL46374.1 2-dehydropantoate 2-reductase [Dehalococcoidia bacterium]MDP6664699.1 2-dehydropantoate 2-reductase [SAR202 cluster bacterium]MDP6800517.1 2-dehydropantoate 2-reductase [SAR202 cluster bacterium]|tara:strand:+ start:4692 stop:5627 length:936 start_codon:yes stop_codon:yes gene_type:complete